MEDVRQVQVQQDPLQPCPGTRGGLNTDYAVQMVTQVLDSRGVLSRLKAELRANVFMAINDHDVASGGHGLSKRSDNDRRTQLLKTADGQLLAHLVKEYIDWTGLAFTGQVYDVEVGLEQAPQDRTQLCSQLSLGAEPSKGPLLLQLLQGHMSGGHAAQQQPAWAAKQPLPASSKGAGEPLQALADKQERASSLGGHQEEEGGLIGTSIYDTLTGSLRKEVSQHSSGSSSARSSAHPVEEHSLPGAASSAASSRRTSAHDSGSGGPSTAASSRRHSTTQRSLSGELELPDTSSSGGQPGGARQQMQAAAAVPAAVAAPAALAPMPAPRVPPRLGPLGPLKPLPGRLAPVAAAAAAEPSPRLPTSDQLREELLQAGLLLSPRPSAEPTSSPSPPPHQPQAAMAAASRPVYADEDSDSEEAEGLLAAAAQVLGLPPGGGAAGQGRAAAAGAAADGGADLEVSSVSEEVLDIPEDIVVGGQDLEEDYSGLFAAQGPTGDDTGAAELDALHLQLEESEGEAAGEEEGQAEALGLPSADASLQLQASGLHLVDRSGGLEELLADADFVEDAL